MDEPQNIVLVEEAGYSEFCIVWPTYLKCSGKGETSLMWEQRDVPDVTGCGEQGSNVMGDKWLEGGVSKLTGESPSHVCKSTGITELYTYYGLILWHVNWALVKLLMKNQYHCMCLKVATFKHTDHIYNIS